MAIPTNGQFMQQFYYTQPANTQDRSAWVPGSGVQTSQAYGGQPAGYAPQQPQQQYVTQQYQGYPPQQQYAAYQQPQQYGGYPPQQQQWPPQQPQQGWGQQAVAYQQYPQGPMGYPPQGPMGRPPMPQPGSVPWMPAQPTAMGPKPGGLLGLLQQFGGNLDGLLPEDINPYVSARPNPQGRETDMVVARLAGLVGQITDVINQLGTVVQQLVNNQPVLTVAPVKNPLPSPVATAPATAPVKTPADGSIEALLASLGFGGATPPPADTTVAANTNDSENDRLIAELLGQIG